MKIMTPILLLALLAGCQERPPIPVEVESADPPFLEQGVRSVDVTIKGQGFETGSLVRFFASGTEDAGGVTVNSTRFVDANTLVTNVDVATDAATGVFDVEVETGGRTGKGMEVFGVVPKSEEQAGTASFFERIKGLAGRWEGITYWSNDPDNRVVANLTYYLTGRGSSVVENFSTGTSPSMTSVYHTDGDDLRMSHFCSARNQPRLKATHVDEKEGLVSFSLVDITNLAEPTAGHVSGFELRITDDDHLTSKFTFSTNGKELYEFLELTRVQE